MIINDTYDAHNRSKVTLVYDTSFSPCFIIKLIVLNLTILNVELNRIQKALKTILDGFALDDSFLPAATPLMYAAKENNHEMVKVNK